MKNKKVLRPLTTKEKAILIPSLLPGFIVKGAIKLPWSFRLWEIHALIIQQREHLGYYYSQNDWQEVRA